MISLATERYRRLCKTAGITFGFCLIAFTCFLLLTATSGGEPQPWIGVAGGVSFLACLTSGVLFIVAAMVGRMKSKAPRDQGQSRSPSSDFVPPTETEAPAAPGSVLTSEQRAGRAILGCVFAL